MRFYSVGKDQGNGRVFVRSLFFLLFQATVLIAIASVFSLIILGLHAPEWRLLIPVAGIMAICSGWGANIDAMQIAERKRKIVAFHQVLREWGKFLFALLMIWTFQANSMWAISGFSIAYLVVLFSQFFFYHKQLKPFLEQKEDFKLETIKEWQLKLVKFTIPVMLWGGMTWLKTVSDRWALGMFVDTSSVGLYAVLLQIGYVPVVLCGGLFIQLLTPIMYSLSGDASCKRNLAKADMYNLWMVISIFMLTSMGVIVSSITHKLIFSLVVAEEFRIVSKFLPAMVLSAGIFMAGNLASVMLTSRLNTKSVAIPMIGTSIFGIILNIIFAKFYGITGVILIQPIAPILYFIWLIYILRPMVNWKFIATQTKSIFLSVRVGSH